MNQPATVNATDRNTATATGMWTGHITLPSAFLSGLLLGLMACFLLVIHWSFAEINSIRERLIAREKVIDRFIEKTVTPPAATPVPTFGPSEP